MKQDTKMIHGYQMIDETTGASSIPKYQASTFHQGNFLHGQEFTYSRFGNPTISAAEEAIASLENGNYGVAFSSGVAAISAVLLLLSSGDHVIMCRDIYGGTYNIVKNALKRFNIEVSFVDEENVSAWEEEIKDNTKMLYIESPSNPLLKITDIRAVAQLGKENQLVSVCDNTFMTPYYQTPLDLGVDIVIHSATKYINGHSDVVAGFVVTNSERYFEKIRSQQINLGSVLGVEEAWLTMRGLKTLAIRMEKSEDNAKKIASYLSTCDHKVKEVFHPSLVNHLGREVHEKQAKGYGGILSFELENKECVACLFDAIKYPLVAVSLGGVESILSYPWSMSHGAMSPSEKLERGVTEGLVRFSTGIENADDLIQDLDQALDLVDQKSLKKETGVLN